VPGIFATAVTVKLDRAPAIVAADPQASTFSQLTGFSVDTSAALYAFLFSIALETAAMFAMTVAYSSPKIAPKPEPAERQKETTPASAEIALPERPTPRLVSSNPPSVGFIEFAGGALERHTGSEVEFDDFYLAYWQHCKALDGRALAPTEAVEQPTNSAANATSQSSAAARDDTWLACVSRVIRVSNSGLGQWLASMGKAHDRTTLHQLQ
jgi:hypothetical protein